MAKARCSSGPSRLRRSWSVPDCRNTSHSAPTTSSTSPEARDRGLEFLTVPDNYYDDLVARFDLAPEIVAQLRELGLLYDREAGGEFVHFYTATVGEVFFEVVQRNGGYDGYGAANAPVRLAAQRASEARLYA